MRILILFGHVLGLLVLAIIVLVTLSLVSSHLAIPREAVGPVISATAVFSGVLVAFLGFQLNLRSHQDPWFIAFKDIHKEFWDDENLEEVRAWICSDQCYKSELLPILKARVEGPVGKDEYKILEKIDRYCALMIRVYSLPVSKMSREQAKLYEALGYKEWLLKTRARTELYEYIAKHWRNLHTRMQVIE